ncbi:gamma-interferon-inducible lysosomal thiol reductase [Galendromus occidentalis]|uniref:Gamma-interferon-inducible lysosomal thiol reductase n=1 Tax=Galendromus occidentalis TaxID=34638 RepID=A0AAJ6QUR2_9ACAR|nr:gamma-interferon-inducible lysosomal thiol reductase [Galendromus occidentalis]
MITRAALLLGVACLASAIPNVMLFYESLCPDCGVEMKTGVVGALRKFGDSVFFSLVPYGNARTSIGRNGSLEVQCQHGEDECTGNVWHACSHLYMTPLERVNYAICTMMRGEENVITLLKMCTTKEKVALLKACAESPMGSALIKLMADITDTAGAVWNNRTRRLDGVPTVFIDGFPVSSAEQAKYSLPDLICLKSKHKPAIC